MFRQTYQSMNQRLSPGPRLEQDTLEKMAARRAGIPAARRRPRRLLSVAVALALVCVLSVTAFAAVPGLGGFLAELLPPAWQERLAPTAVGDPVADQGIALNVPAAISDADSADIFFTLTDQEGGRLSSTARVAGVLSGEGWQQDFSAAPVHYDPDTRTAAYRCSVSRPGALDGASLNLTITELLGSRSEEDFSLPLENLTLTQPTGTVSYALDPEEDLLARTWEARYNALVKDGSMTFLAPGEPQALPAVSTFNDEVPVEVEGVALTGAAYVDGQLHLQFHLENAWKSALLYTGGTNSDPEFEPNTTYSTRQWESGYRYENGQITGLLGDGELYQNNAPVLGCEYLELISDIPQEKLGYVTLELRHVTYETALAGTWSQDFALQSADDTALTLTGPYTVQVETKHLGEGSELTFQSTYSGATIDSIRVTPMGITVTRAATAQDEAPEIDGILKRIAPDISKLEITLETTAGEELTYQLDRESYTVLPDESGNMTARYTTDVPVDTGAIARLTVNGVEIPLS